MAKRTIVITVFGLIGCMLLLAATSGAYTIRNNASGDLLWHDDEAYVFLEIGSFGYRSSYLQYVAQAITAFFNVSVPATDKNHRTIVFRLNQKGFEQYESRSLMLGPEMVPLDGTIYSDSDRGLVKWSGSHFEPVSAEEKRRFEIRTGSGPDFTKVNGWSRRSFIFNKGTDSRILHDGGDVKFELELNGEPHVIIVTHGESGENLSLSWEQPGHGAQKLWYLDLRPHRISRSEYELIFGKH